MLLHRVERSLNEFYFLIILKLSYYVFEPVLSTDIQVWMTTKCGINNQYFCPLKYTDHIHRKMFKNYK